MEFAKVISFWSFRNFASLAKIDFNTTLKFSIVPWKLLFQAEILQLQPYTKDMSSPSENKKVENDDLKYNVINYINNCVNKTYPGLQQFETIFETWTLFKTVTNSQIYLNKLLTIIIWFIKETFKSISMSSKIWSGFSWWPLWSWFRNFASTSVRNKKKHKFFILSGHGKIWKFEKTNKI